VKIRIIDPGKDDAMRRVAATLLLLVVFRMSVAADDWPAAKVREVFSDSRDWFVRVTPGTSLGELVGFAGALRGRRATALFFRRLADGSYRKAREITTRNPVAPVDFVVTDRGFLVTLDNWHNRGYGNAVGVYSAAGNVVASLELKDLFSADEIAAFQHSESSIAWRRDTVYVRQGQQSVYVALDQKGRELIVEVGTGRWQICEPRGTHLCRDSNAPRTWRPYREPATGNEPSPR
jgi:hypothetical protein